MSENTEIDLRKNTRQPTDKSVPVRLRDGTLECLMWWSNPLPAPIYKPQYE